MLKIQLCAPDDGWRYHPKHVEQLPEINNLSNLCILLVIYQNILTMHGPLKVKYGVSIMYRCYLYFIILIVG